jgi:hypothetical protein
MEDVDEPRKAMLGLTVSGVDPTKPILGSIKDHTTSERSAIRINAFSLSSSLPCSLSLLDKQETSSRGDTPTPLDRPKALLDRSRSPNFKDMLSASTVRDFKHLLVPVRVGLVVVGMNGSRGLDGERGEVRHEGVELGGLGGSDEDLGGGEEGELGAEARDTTWRRRRREGRSGAFEQRRARRSPLESVSKVLA